MVCRLKKVLYGLRQAPRAWYARLDKYIILQGFKKGTTSNNLYFTIEDKILLIVVVYVDDIIFGVKYQACKIFAKDIQKEFEMLMIGQLSFFLCLQVAQLDDGIFISQEKYVKEILKKFGMENSKPVGTSMVIGCHLSKDDESLEVDQTLYRSMIGGLLYLTTSRPNIMHAICMVARY